VGGLGGQCQGTVSGRQAFTTVDVGERGFAEAGGDGVKVCPRGIHPQTRLSQTTDHSSSVGAHIVVPSLSAYQPSKLAVLRFTQFIDAEYASQGVTAITVHPGNILTEMATSGDIPEELQFVFTETVELPADTTVWLTAKKREWLGGRYVNVTWDMPQLEEKREAIVEGDRLKVKLDVDF
jgi:NAD(P)-dependent dehydrogenase (short-subunit alcohol dehydrogenase family)